MLFDRSTLSPRNLSSAALTLQVSWWIVVPLHILVSYLGPSKSTVMFVYSEWSVRSTTCSKQTDLESNQSKKSNILVNETKQNKRLRETFAWPKNVKVYKLNNVNCKVKLL